MVWMRKKIATSYRKTERRHGIPAANFDNGAVHKEGKLPENIVCFISITFFKIYWQGGPHRPQHLCRGQTTCMTSFTPFITWVSEAEVRPSSLQPVSRHWALSGAYSHIHFKVRLRPEQGLRDVHAIHQCWAKSSLLSGVLNQTCREDTFSPLRITKAGHF